MSVLTLIRNVLFTSIIDFTLANCQKHEFCSDNTPENCKKLEQFVLLIFIQFESVNCENKQRFFYPIFTTVNYTKQYNFFYPTHIVYVFQMKTYLNTCVHTPRDPHKKKLSERLIILTLMQNS